MGSSGKTLEAVQKAHQAKHGPHSVEQLEHEKAQLRTFLLANHALHVAVHHTEHISSQKQSCLLWRMADAKDSPRSHRRRGFLKMLVMSCPSGHVRKEGNAIITVGPDRINYQKDENDQGARVL